MPRIAICVITIGESYIQFYEKYFKPSQERYCKRYGYDLVTIPHFLDSNKERHCSDYLTYQKILIAGCPQVQDYDYVLILDADIYICQTAGPLTELIDQCGDKIGLVNEACDPSYPIREEINRYKQWPVTPTAYYKKILPYLQFETSLLLNTGLLFIQPKLHKAFFEEIDRVYGKDQMKHPCGAHFEGAILGYELQVQNKVHVIDNKWNCIFLAHAENPHQNLMDPDFFYGVFLSKYWFLHFCAKQFLSFAEFLEQSNL